MSLRIPLAKPEITDADREAVHEVLCTSQLSMGPRLHEFEQAICDYTGAKHAVAENSGTSALQLAVRALDLKPGAEVILPSFTFSALLNVILEEGLQPRFVDIAPGSFNTTPDLVAAAITPQTKLLLAVHTFGFPVDTLALRNLAQSRGLHMIEDACEALGAEVRGQKAGTLGDAGMFAFYPNKQITTGEGGMLVTSNAQLAATAARLRNQGRDASLDWNQHTEVGFSYRMSDINCALGVSQLRRIEAIVARRQQLAEMYHQALANIAELILPPLTSKLGRISRFVYPVQLAAKFDAGDRDFLCRSLLQKGIATARYFAPLHRQPVVASHPFAKSGTGLAHTEALADRVIALPFFNELTAAEIQDVCGALKESISDLRRKT